MRLNKYRKIIILIISLVIMSALPIIKSQANEGGRLLLNFSYDGINDVKIPVNCNRQLEFKALCDYIPGHELSYNYTNCKIAEINSPFLTITGNYNHKKVLISLVGSERCDGFDFSSIFTKFYNGQHVGILLPSYEFCNSYPDGALCPGVNNLKREYMLYNLTGERLVRNLVLNSQSSYIYLPLGKYKVIGNSVKCSLQFTVTSTSNDFTIC